MLTVFLALRQQMDHAHRNWESGAEVWVEVRREGVENRRLRRFLRARGARALLRRVVALYFTRGVVVVAAHVDEVHRARPANAVLPQLLEFEAFAVLAADVHEEGVVGDAEYPGGLARRHLLVPYVLKRLRELGVRPGAGRAASGCRVLALRSSHLNIKVSCYRSSRVRRL